MKNLENMTTSELNELSESINREFYRRAEIKDLIDFPEGNKLPIKIIQIKKVVLSMSGKLKYWHGTAEIDGKIFKNKEFHCRQKYDGETSSLKINGKIYGFNWIEYFMARKDDPFILEHFFANKPEEWGILP